jgi:quinoprotein glucose dehydrogenase
MLDIHMPRGIVRAFNASTGALLWTFSPIPNPGDPAVKTWGNGTNVTGAANVWGAMSGDEDLGLIFVGSGSPSVDPWGGNRLGMNEWADSIIALNLNGTKRWSFQTGPLIAHFNLFLISNICFGVVHHDLWDYDLACQPSIFVLKGKKVIACATKIGFLFILDALTGTRCVVLRIVLFN